LRLFSVGHSRDAIFALPSAFCAVFLLFDIPPFSSFSLFSFLLILYLPIIAITPFLFPSLLLLLLSRRLSRLAFLLSRFFFRADRNAVSCSFLLEAHDQEKPSAATRSPKAAHERNKKINKRKEIKLLVFCFFLFLV
jgi:hypothetical protein